MSAPRILVVEDDEHLAAALAGVCRRLGAEVRTCYAGGQALREADASPFAAVVLDLGLPDLPGLHVLAELRRAHPALPVVVITAHGTLDNALAAQRLGVETFLIKPVDMEVVAATLGQVLQAVAERPPSPPRAEGTAAELSTLLVGSSPRMQRAFVRMAQACGSAAHALITGPSGSGKSLVARVIHANGARRDGPFVALVCSALPESLVESELFGHERHAFTGAAAMRIGHVERAAGGTLFLDEIGDLSPALQAKLLRLLDDRVYHRVGGRQDLRLDARILAATHKDLASEVKAGRFREDLYFRLRVLEVELPPLRERADDIPMLCDVFLAASAQGRDLRLAEETRRLLQTYAWPGNVRELRHALEHAVAAASGRFILPSHLPPALRGLPESDAQDAPLAAALHAWIGARLAGNPTYESVHDALERLLLADLLARFGGKPSVLARALDLNRVTLLAKRRRLGLDR